MTTSWIVASPSSTSPARRDPGADPSIDWNAPVETKDNTHELNDYIKSYREGAEGGMPYSQYNLGVAYRWGV
ncbi:hypothetical protein, partial [Escherichia coli]|uniref:hypothetical protein n=1 Tax=Escherichia coli TaxID=562 RepID=UPI001F2771FC